MNKFKFKATHHGNFLGVPVWLDMRNGESPAIKPKFGCHGKCWMWVMELLFGCFVLFQTLDNPEYEPEFPIMLGDTVKDKEQGDE